MNRKQSIKFWLILALFSLSLGGWLMHYRFHNPLSTGYGTLPFVIGLISVFLLPFLFWFSSTIAYAYVINTIQVIIGTITMAHFSLAYFKGPLTVSAVVFNTLLPDILLLWGSLLVGKALFDLELLRSDQDVIPAAGFIRFFRFPNTGWIVIHFFMLGLVYALGHVLWQ